MATLPTPQPEGIFFSKPSKPSLALYEELRDELGNRWMLIGEEWVLVEGQRHRQCLGTFESLAPKLNPPGTPDRAVVGGIGYRRVRAQKTEGGPIIDGFIEIKPALDDQTAK